MQTNEPAPIPEGGYIDTTPKFHCGGSKHRWAMNWLKAENWRPEAWAIYALQACYQGRHDGERAIPARVRAFADDVWRDLREERITTTTTILDYEADFPSA